MSQHNSLGHLTTVAALQQNTLSAASLPASEESTNAILTILLIGTMVDKANNHCDNTGNHSDGTGNHVIMLVTKVTILVTMVMTVPMF